MKRQNYLSVFGAARPLTPRDGILGLARPQRSLDDEMRALISRHGADSVQASFKKLTRKKKGRKQENDWAILAPFFREDALIWLDGGDPYQRRKNYWLAQKVSEIDPGHNETATHRRVMRKLSANRRLITLIHALIICEKERPYPDFFRTVDAMLALSGKPAKDAQGLADARRGFLERYRETLGEPDQEKTFPQLDAELTDYFEQLPLLGGGLLGVNRQ